jgi:NAD(P)-dependent dehydrogenase (short-subunit alcohol dehydrogenase family)
MDVLEVTGSSTVIITGASSGIGAVTARLLHKAGAHPVLAARRADRLAVLSEQLVEPPGAHLLGQPAPDHYVRLVRVDGLHRAPDRRLARRHEPAGARVPAGAGGRRAAPAGGRSPM